MWFLSASQSQPCGALWQTPPRMPSTILPFPPAHRKTKDRPSRSWLIGKDFPSSAREIRLRSSGSRSPGLLEKGRVAATGPTYERHQLQQWLAEDAKRIILTVRRGPGMDANGERPASVSKPPPGGFFSSSCPAERYRGDTATRKHELANDASSPPCRPPLRVLLPSALINQPAFPSCVGMWLSQVSAG